MWLYIDSVLMWIYNLEFIIFVFYAYYAGVSNVLSKEHMYDFQTKCPFWSMFLHGHHTLHCAKSNFFLVLLQM